jgi:lysophospholipase L1-like esterase
MITKKEILNRVFLTAASLVIMLILMELIIRLMPYKYNYKADSHFYEPIHRYSNAREVMYELVPNSGFEDSNNLWHVPIHINSYGFRYRDFTLEKARDDIRVLVLGDSVTFGPGVEENKTYTLLLEQMLKKRNETRQYEIINTAVVGYSPIQEAYFLKARGLEFKPDVIFIGFCMQKDFYAPRVMGMTTENGAIDTISVSETPTPYAISENVFTRYLMENFEFYRFLNTKLDIIFGKYGFVPEDYYSEGEMQTYKAFDMIDEMTMSPIVVIGLPFDVEAYGENAKMRKIRKLNLNRKLLSELSVEHGFYYIDLTHKFYSNNQSLGYLWQDGLHFSREGHSVAAKAIFEYLNAEDLI